MTPRFGLFFFHSLLNHLNFFFSILFVCFLGLQVFAQPASQWFTSHNGSGPESHGHFILSCSDGGFLQIGETGFIPNTAKILVVKTDPTGNLQWQKEFNTGGHNLGNSAYELNDGYLICGALNRNSALIKLDKNNGNTIFNKTYNNGGTDAIEHIAETPSGFIAVGYINALDADNTFYTEGQGYLTFIDAAGNKTSGMNISAYTSHAYRIKTYNGTLLVSGLSMGAEEYNILKFDFAGNNIWSKSYGGSNYDHCFGLDINCAGEIFLTGHTISGTQNWDTYTLKLDNNGNLLWEQKTGNPRGFNPQYIHDEAWGIKATADGGCIIVAGTGDEYNSYSDCNANGCSDVWRTYLVKYDANGNIDCQQTYFDNNAVDWAGEDIDLTSDGGAIVSVDDGTFGFLKIAPFESNRILNIRVLLQGAYNGTDMNIDLGNSNLIPLTNPYGLPEIASSIPADAVDWIKVEIRAASDATTVLATRAAFLRKDGYIIDLNGREGICFPGLTANSGYVSVHHRNHLGVMTNNLVSF